MMQLAEQFIEAVKRNMPVTLHGAVPHSVDYPDTRRDATIVAVYFLRAFGPDGKPLAEQPPLSDMAHDWRQVSLHITASGHEIRMNASNLDDLAKRRIAAAFSAVPADDPFFAVAA